MLSKTVRCGDCGAEGPVYEMQLADCGNGLLRYRCRGCQGRVVTSAGDFIFEGYKERVNELRRAVHYLERAADVLKDCDAFSGLCAEIRLYLLMEAPALTEYSGAHWRRVLQPLIEQYLTTVPDDEGDDYDYELERTLTYREAARQRFEAFLRWANDEQSAEDMATVERMRPVQAEAAALNDVE